MDFQKRNSSENEPIVLNDIEITPKRIDDFRTTPNKLIDIIHMDLEVSFNWGKHQCMGTQQLLIKPYFYNTDSIILDAKSMVFDGISISDLNNYPIQYLLTYNKKLLVLKLEKMLSLQDTVILKISYIASPDEVEKGGSKAIKESKGLYFINTNNTEPHKPIQLWTQGETEANSCWFPTIDKPNEKFTSTLSITVNKDMTTLSNGILVNSVVNGNTRTDVWDNKLPMPAYLTMMAVGNFSTTEDESWEGKKIDYYLEPAYHPYAKNIFKNTAEMINFYSDILGVKYPWDKYSQVVVRDYVSGAMENTSATLHGEFVQKNNRELLDGGNDGIISHELFHQWFGDLVTCESWSHLTLNEGFASYGELLWVEHKLGKDAALKKGYEALNKYINYTKNAPDDAIINFNYKNQEDLFNAITYQKGSRVLHLLRNIIGDEAFFTGLKNYLTHFAFNNAQIDDLRKEFEHVCGRDLRPFFQQWFMRGGHPEIEIRYEYIDSVGLLAVTVEQKSQHGLFQFPLTFKVTQGQKTKDFIFDISKKKEIFYVKKIDEENKNRVDVNVDPEGTFIGEIKDNKPFFNYILTYYRANNYLEKIRPLKELSLIQNQNDTIRKTILSAINDADDDIRLKALDWIDWKNPTNLQESYDYMLHLARNDPNSLVRAKVCTILGDTKNPIHVNLFSDLINDSSYSVSAEALLSLYKLVPEVAYKQCNMLEKDARGKLFSAIATIYSQQGTQDVSRFFEENMMKVFNGKRADLINKYQAFLIHIQDIDFIKNHVAIIKERAQLDQNTSVRFASLQALYQIRVFLEKSSLSIQDEQRKMIYKNEIENLIQTFNELVNQESDSSVISQLKFNKLIPGDFVIQKEVE